MAIAARHIQGGHVRIDNLLFEHAGDLGLTAKEQQTLNYIMFYQDHPKYRAVPSLSLLAEKSRVSYSWTRRNVKALSGPLQDATGSIVRPAYMTQVIRRDGTIWYDLTLLERALLAYLPQKKEEQPPKKAPPADTAPVPLDPIARHLKKIFASWCERDRNAPVSLARVKLAAELAGWQGDELRDALEQCAALTTQAGPRRHVPHFLKTVENFAAEVQMRKERARQYEAEERERERISRAAWAAYEAEQQAETIAAAPAPAPMPEPTPPLPEIEPTLIPINRDEAKEKGWRLSELQVKIRHMRRNNLIGAYLRQLEREARALADELGAPLPAFGGA
jgi:hypothetical protein